jgi:hypothetical protein
LFQCMTPLFAAVLLAGCTIAELPPLPTDSSGDPSSDIGNDVSTVDLSVTPEDIAATDTHQDMHITDTSGDDVAGTDTSGTDTSGNDSSSTEDVTDVSESDTSFVDTESDSGNDDVWDEDAEDDSSDVQADDTSTEDGGGADA